jgi:hypothetical protein
MLFGDPLTACAITKKRRLNACSSYPSWITQSHGDRGDERQQAAVINLRIRHDHRHAKHCMIWLKAGAFTWALVAQIPTFRTIGQCQSQSRSVPASIIRNEIWLARLYKRLSVEEYHRAALVLPPLGGKMDVCKSPNFLPKSVV